MRMMRIRPGPGDVASTNLDRKGYGMTRGIQLFVEWLLTICTELIMFVSVIENQSQGGPLCDCMQKEPCIRVSLV